MAIAMGTPRIVGWIPSGLAVDEVLLRVGRDRRIPQDLEGLDAVPDVDADGADGSVVANADAARQVEVVESDARLLWRYVAHVAKRRGRERAMDVDPKLVGPLPQREAADRDRAGRRVRVVVVVGGRCATGRGLAGGRRRVQERDDAVGGDPANREASVRRRTARVEATEEDGLDVADAFGAREPPSTPCSSWGRARCSE